MKYIKNSIKFENHLDQVSKGLKIFEYLNKTTFYIVQSDEEWKEGTVTLSDLKELLRPYLNLIIEGCQEGKKMLREEIGKLSQ